MLSFAPDDLCGGGGGGGGGQREGLQHPPGAGPLLAPARGAAAPALGAGQARPEVQLPLRRAQLRAQLRRRPRRRPRRPRPQRRAPVIDLAGNR